jgi:hypothetical protein
MYLSFYSIFLQLHMPFQRATCPPIKHQFSVHSNGELQPRALSYLKLRFGICLGSDGLRELA